MRVARLSSAHGPTRTEGSAQAVGGPLGTSGPAGQQDTGAAIRAAAKQLSPITPLAPDVDGLTDHRRSPRLK
jgi:hypothetical protein